MRFADYTITAVGEVRSRRRQYSERLEPRALQFFRDLLHGRDGFCEPVPLPELAHIELRWTAPIRGVALATCIARGELATTSILLSGDAGRAEELRVLAMVQRELITSIVHPLGVEPAFDALSIEERPVIASLVWPNPALGRSPSAHEDLALIADMETCLGAAWFEELRA